ncbi:MAG: coproporphyrinogen-III oxidase family protein [Frankiaceae bacterium]
MGRPLLVYVHVPFCTAKCLFCDWVTEISPADLRLGSESTPRRRYLGALATHIAVRGEALVADGYEPRILYWGGGTASILAEAEIERVMAALTGTFDLSRLDEATIECSPETLSPTKLALLRSLGFDRISIGVQSFDDHRLHAIGRQHDAESAVRAVEDAWRAGFSNINIDLISGFPGETVQELEASLRRALALPISHVSLYPYRPALGTGMRATMRDGRAGTIQLSEQLAAYRLGQSLLEEAGLAEYALAHFGSRRCFSDLAYFQLRMDWAGFGSGAASLLDRTFSRTRNGGLHDYLDRPTEPDDVLPASDPGLLNRWLYQALSTFEGADARLWLERTGTSLAETLARPESGQLLAQLGASASDALERDERGIRLRRDAIAPAFIRMLFASAPSTAREADLAEAVLGGY